MLTLYKKKEGRVWKGIEKGLDQFKKENRNNASFYPTSSKSTSDWDTIGKNVEKSFGKEDE